MGYAHLGKRVCEDPVGKQALNYFEFFSVYAFPFELKWVQVFFS